jgi:hypothetical protein
MLKKGFLQGGIRKQYKKNITLFANEPAKKEKPGNRIITVL